MSGRGGRQGVQLAGRYWPTEKSDQLLHGGSRVKSVQDRAVEVMQPGVERTPKQLASELHCSYSTARTALVKLFYAGELERKTNETSGQCTYFLGDRAGS